MCTISIELKDLPGEVWKDICGYEGLYMVSNKGRVKSLPHRVKRGFCDCITEEKILNPTTNGHYNKVCLFSGSKASCSQRFIHRLVALAFIPNPNGYPQIDHIDGNQTNNVVENLRWCTQTQNVNNPITRFRSNRLKKVISYSLSGRKIKEYQSLAEASKDTRIPVSSIHCIANKKAGMDKYSHGIDFKYL